MLIGKHQLSYYFIFIANLSQLMESSDYLICGAVVNVAIETRMKGPLQNH